MTSVNDVIKEGLVTSVNDDIVEELVSNSQGANDVIIEVAVTS